MTRQRAVIVALAALGLAAAPAWAQSPPSSPNDSALASESSLGSLEQKISLDLKGVDILDVLKLLSQKSGLNFVAGRNVSGRVTIFAKDVGIWKAFEQIISANDLAYEQQGDLINVMTARDYELLYGERFQERLQQKVVPLKYAKANQVATALNQLKSNLGRVVVDEGTNTLIVYDTPIRLKQMDELLVQLDRQTETRIYNLNYADVDKLKEKLQDFLTPGVGTFSADARTSKIVVTDLSDAIATIDQVIRAYDEREQDVLIEARIVKVDLTDQTSFGIDWQRVLGGIDSKGRLNFRVLDDIVGGTAKGAALKFVSARRGDTQIVLEALKTYGNVETISNPRIMASNNQEARILVGKKEAFVTSTTTVPATGSTTVSPEVQFMDVGTKLFITPNIKRDGHIQLKIRPEVSSVFDTVTTIANTRIPLLSTTEAETNVLVKSGSTLIIGGLIETVSNVSRNQLPILGDLPLIGAAFRGTVDKKTKSELVVFLTPQIISASGEHLTQFPSGVSVHAVDRLEPLDGGLVPAAYHETVRDYLTQSLGQQLRAAGLGTGTVDISILLSRDGYIAETPSISSPDGEAFENAARVALNAAAPFPPFPSDATALQARFHVEVQYAPAPAS